MIHSMNNISLKESIGISMPVLNEVNTIAQVLTEMIKELREINYTICIVDDGSTDGTLDIINNFINKAANIQLIKTKKKSYGCQRGAASRTALEWLIAHTNHTIFVEIDADGAQHPNELLNGIKLISGSNYDIAIASKYVDGSKIIGRSVFRNFVSLCMSSIARLLISPGIRDYSNSYRFYNRRSAKLILKSKPKYTSPIYLFEILVIWIANDYAITEIPTTYNAKNNSTSKVTMIDMIKGFFSLLEISFRFRKGAFNAKQT